jgi:hypothetical protein
MIILMVAKPLLIKSIGYLNDVLLIAIYMAIPSHNIIEGT